MTLFGVEFGGGGQVTTSSIPNGSIIPAPVTITEAQFEPISNTSPTRYALKLRFLDNNYFRTQNSAGGPYQQEDESADLNCKRQAAYQLPPYIIRILKKTTPETRTTGNTRIETLWESVSSFNDQEYQGSTSDLFLPTGQQTFTATGLGVGLTPYYYYYKSEPWRYDNIDIVDATTNGLIELRFDASGGVSYIGGPGVNGTLINANGFPGSTSQQNTPLKQACHHTNTNPNTSNLELPFFKFCEPFNPLNGFTDPGAYLIVVMRNSIDNQQWTGGFGTVFGGSVNAWMVTDNNTTKPNISSALAIIRPPPLVLTYEPNVGINNAGRLSFTVNAYGSNLITNTNEKTWSLTNPYSGTPNFSTPTFPYNTTTLSNSTPNGSFPTSDISFSPIDRLSALDSLSVSIDLWSIRVLEESIPEFSVTGAFMYDFRLVPSGTPSFLPYSRTNVGNWPYVNFPLVESSTINVAFQPDFYNVWYGKLQSPDNVINPNTVFYNNRFVTFDDYAPIVNSNAITLPSSLSIPVVLTAEIINIGTDNDPKYIFQTSWREPFPEALTTEIVNAKYALRLYKRSSVNTSGSRGSEYINNPISPYQYISTINTGVTIQTEWKTTSEPPSAEPYYTMDIYADKQGIIYYNNAPTSSVITNTSQYWSKDEILGAWLIVLQRNFTTPSDSQVNIITSGSFLKHIPEPPALTIKTNSGTNGESVITGLETIPTNQIAIAKNFWSKKNGEQVTRLSENLINVPNPTITQIRGIYPYNPNETELFNHVEINLGISDDIIQENLGGFTGIGNPIITGIDGLSNMFYDSSSNTVNINPPITPTTLNVDIITGDFGFGTNNYFKINWTEPLSNELTQDIVGAKNVLRIYKYTANPNTGEGDYLSNPLSFAMFTGSPRLSGLSLDNPGGISPLNPELPTLYINSLGGVSTTTFALGRGWTDNEMSGSWLFILQRNFSQGDQLNLVTQGAYYVNLFGETPQLALAYDTDGFPSSLVTTPTGQFANTSNTWSASTNQITFENIAPNNDLVNVGNLSIATLDQYWPSTNNISYIKNDVSLNFGVDGGIFTEPYTQINNPVTTNINTPSGVSLIYSGTTNNLEVYAPNQTESSINYINNAEYTYETYQINNNTYVYFDVSFNDPSPDLLISNAYNINILKKQQGSGSDISQWQTIQNYTYESKNNPGNTITKSSIIPDPLVTPLPVKLNMLANGTITQDAVDDNSFEGQTGILSFDIGAYLVVIRRNFSGTFSSGGTWPLYTINSGYIYILPSSINWIYNANPSSVTYSLNVPIAGSFSNSGNLNISNVLYVKTDGVEKPSYKNATIGFSSSVSNNINTLIIHNTSIIQNYPNDGPINMFTEFSYDWSAPSNFTLDIGKIGSGNNNGVAFTFANPIPAVRKINAFTPWGAPLSANQIMTNIFRILMPSNNSWNYQQGNIIRDVKASFSGNNTNRMMAIRWEDFRSTNLYAGSSRSPYELRVYKKQKEGFSSNDQWFQPTEAEPRQSVSSVINGKSYNLININADFLPLANLSRNDASKKIMFLFMDKSGKIFYNTYPEDPSVIIPFTDDDAGGYMIIIQRNFTQGNNIEDQFISTHGQYLYFLPSTPLELDVELPNVFSNPNLYSSYLPGNQGGTQDVKYTWSLSLPNINYSNIIVGANSSSLDVETFKNTFNHHDKSATIVSNVTYNFGVAQMPFVEAYPLLSITGNPFFQTSSLPYTIDLCVKPTSFPPPPWSRFTLSCPDVTPEEREQLQMRRKAETLMHVSNRFQRGSTRAQKYSYVAQGFNQRRQTYATQTDTYTDPNTKNYPVLGRSLVLPDQCTPRVLTFPSTSSDVPGPTVPLTYDPNVPLLNYIPIRTYGNSLTEYYDEKGL